MHNGRRRLHNGCRRVQTAADGCRRGHDGAIFKKVMTMPIVVVKAVKSNGLHPTPKVLADVCRRVHNGCITGADARRRLQAAADGCIRVQTSADGCRRVQTGADGAMTGRFSKRSEHAHYRPLAKLRSGGN